MNLTNYKQIIKDTMEEVAFANPDSVASKAEVKLKEFLDNNTAIPEDEKAKVYANFLQNIVVTTINQAIQAALQLPVNEKQIEIMERETQVKEAIKDSDIAVNNQKIASMQAEDEARRNEVAAKVAKAKVEIEQLIPSQIALNEKELQIKDKQLQIEDKKIALAEKQVELEGEKIPLMKAQTEVEKAKIPLMQAQSQVEQRKVDLMAKEVEVETRKVDLMEAQVDIEKAKKPLIEAQTLVEQKRAVLTENEADLTKTKIPLTEAEITLTKAKTDVAYWDAIMKNKQADTMIKSLDINKEIEKCKCETNLKIAQIQAESL